MRPSLSKPDAPSMTSRSKFSVSELQQANLLNAILKRKSIKCGDLDHLGFFGLHIQLSIKTVRLIVWLQPYCGCPTVTSKRRCVCGDISEMSSVFGQPLIRRRHGFECMNRFVREIPMKLLACLPNIGTNINECVQRLRGVSKNIGHGIGAIRRQTKSMNFIPQSLDDTTQKIPHRLTMQKVKQTSS